MSTNYYLHTNECKHCGRSDTPLHIGKSSSGWCFSLHVTDEIRTLDEWKEKWSAPDVIIKDEYGCVVSPDDMLDNITDRWGNADSIPDPCTMISPNAVRGPNGLLRHRVDDRHCIGHGDGTWDLIRGIFS